MIKRVSIIGVAVIIVPVASFSQKGQTVTGHSLTAGISSSRINDPIRQLTGQPLTGAGFRYSFHMTSSRSKQSVIAYYHHAYSNGIGLNEYRIECTSLYSWKHSRDGRLKSFIGFSLATHPLTLSGSDGESSHHSWATANDLSIAFSNVFEWSKQSITIDLQFPIIGFSSRPASQPSGNINATHLLFKSYGNLFVTTLDNRVAPRVTLQYQWQFSGHLGCKVESGYDYQEYKKANGFVQKGFAINGGLTWKGLL